MGAFAVLGDAIAPNVAIVRQRAHNLSGEQKRVKPPPRRIMLKKIRGRRALLAVAALCAAKLAAQVEARTFSSCYTEPGTNKAMCIDELAVSVNGDVRSAPLYVGGPKGVSKTPYFVVVDCKRNVSTLQDSSGVNFAGGMSNQTSAIRDLATSVCNAARTKKDATLGQFTR